MSLIQSSDAPELSLHSPVPSVKEGCTWQCLLWECFREESVKRGKSKEFCAFLDHNALSISKLQSHLQVRHVLGDVVCKYSLYTLIFMIAAAGKLLRIRMIGFVCTYTDEMSLI